MSRSQGASGSSLPRALILVFVVVVAVMLLSTKSVGGDLSEHALAEMKRELDAERRKHQAELAELRKALGHKSAAPDRHVAEEVVPPHEKRVGRAPRATTPPPTSDEPSGSSSGSSGGSEAVEGAPTRPSESPESNDMPESIHHPSERKFQHWIAELPELPEGAPPEAEQVHKALSMYNADRSAETNIPVYGTACIGDVDCKYVKNQLKSLDTGVGHIVVVLNRDHAEFHTYFSAFEKLFPGRFTFAYRPQGGGCADSWNIMLRLGFSITPTPNFVMATNGDLWAMPGYLAKFAKYMHDHLESQVAARFVHFSSFGLNKRGWSTLGPFDEVIYPAYAEDVEYHIRAVSAGVLVGSFPGMAPGKSHQHAGSRSFADKLFGERYQRWDKNDYMFRKWGVDMRQHTDFQHAKPFKHPWNQPSLTHRKSWVLDPAHRECIRTGKGIKHKASRGGCMLSSCQSCWYNASVLLSILPPGTVLPDSIMTQSRVKY